MIHLGIFPRRLHLLCYAVLRVRAVANLHCPAHGATVTVENADRIALRQHSNVMKAMAMAIARRAMSARGRGGLSTRAIRHGRGGRVICSFCQGLAGEIAFVHLSCSCDVHRRCALGFVEEAIPRAYANGARTPTRPVPEPGPTAVHQERGGFSPPSSTDP